MTIVRNYNFIFESQRLKYIRIKIRFLLRDISLNLVDCVIRIVEKVLPQRITSEAQLKQHNLID